MKTRLGPLLSISALILTICWTFAATSEAGSERDRLPEDPRDTPAAKLLENTRFGADLDGDGVDERLILVNALTGAKKPEHASEVIVGITGPEADGKPRAPLLWVRHVSRETGRPAHSGEIAAVDLDGDGGSELTISWDRAVTEHRRERWAEIWCSDAPGELRKVWEGIWEVDTRRDPETPDAERQRFSVEIDYGKTRRLAGRGLVLLKTHTVIAGKTLEEPRVTSETLRVRLRP